jgi:glycosyltransferase involved in cell wall biosynthesis
MAQTRHILHLFGRMARGGAETRTLEVMRHVDRDRFRLHFCALSGEPGELDDEIRSLGGQVHLLPLGPSFPRKFRRLLREHRFDVVQSHVHYPSGYLLRLAAREGTPVRVTHFRITEDGRPMNLPRRLQVALLRRWIDKYSTDILAVSRGTMGAAWRPDWQADPRCRVVYNGIDLTRFADPPDREGVGREFAIPPGDTLYIHVGRLDSQKNHIRLAPVFADIVRADPASRLLVVGRGGNDLERNLRERLAALGVADRVVLTGLRADVPRLLKAADAMIFPSLFEGLPGAVLEACAAGTPVLASDIDVHRETASHLKSVATLPLAASDSDWASAARALASSTRGDPGRRRRAAAEFAASVFSIDQCVRANESVWTGTNGRGVPA